MTDLPAVIAFCPRCDKPFVAATEFDANNLIHEHLKRQIDEVHNGALEQWEEQLFDEKHYGA